MSITKLIRRLRNAASGAGVQRAASIKLGRSASIDSRVEIHAGHLSVGDYTYISGPGRISSLPESRISIGKFVSIASGVQIIGALHKSHITNYSLTRLIPKEQRAAYEHGISKGDISIGSDVWIGVNAVILSGVSVGDGAVIGAGAVVTKDVPPYSVCVGVPAAVRKMRFPKEDVDKLLAARWWDWDDDKIFKCLPLFYDEDISVSEFLARANEIA